MWKKMLNAYKQSPASKSKRRRWGYGGMLMSEGVKAPSDNVRFTRGGNDGIIN